jgi:cell division protein FtsB
MGFIKIFNNKKYTLISMFLFLYVIFNLFDGERGLISYYKMEKTKINLLQEKEKLTQQLAIVEKKNNLLTNAVDLDYLETLYRMKFMVGKNNEEIYLNK